jgi:hypothetical protein
VRPGASRAGYFFSFAFMDAELPRDLSENALTRSANRRKKGKQVSRKMDDQAARKGLRWPSRKRQSSVKTKAAKKKLREQNNGSAASAQSRGRRPHSKKPNGSTMKR